MTLSDIRNECWEQARESTTIDEDRLWRTAEMNRYINRVYRILAKETECIVDSISAFTQLAITGTDETPASYYIALDPRILCIEEAKWATNGYNIYETSIDRFGTPQWEITTGAPTLFTLDWSSGYLAFNCQPTITDTLKLRVRRLPLEDMSASTDVPEFKAQYHDYFINGVLWLMYSKQDAETLNKVKAEEFRQLFIIDIDKMKREVHNLSSYQMTAIAHMACL